MAAIATSDMSWAELLCSGELCACGVKCDDPPCSGFVPCIFPIAIMAFFGGITYARWGFGCTADHAVEGDTPDDCLETPGKYISMGLVGLLIGIVIATCFSKRRMPSLWRFFWDLGCCRRCPGPIQFAVRVGLGRPPYDAQPDVQGVAAAADDVLHATAVQVEVSNPPLADGPRTPPVLEARASDEHLLRVANGLLSSVADTHAECCICIEPLHAEPIATLTRDRRNACAHFLHARCAIELLGGDTLNWAGESVSYAPKACPFCRAEVDGIVRVPALSEDVDKWFFCVDVEGDGRLSRQQVLNVLVAQFPIDKAQLEAALPTLWARWDVDGTGYVSKAEFLHPEKGLMRFVRTTLLREQPQGGAEPGF
jgi:hypothetical protein